MILTLIGYRATGKTTLASRLAERLGWDWIDADVEIEHGRENRSPTSSPRTANRPSAISKLGSSPTSAGGIAWCWRPAAGRRLRAETRLAMREGGKVVWLRARPETILARMSADATTATRRPSLTDKDPLEEIIHVLESPDADLSAVGPFGRRHRGEDARGAGSRESSNN